MIDPHTIVEGFLDKQADLDGVLLYPGEDVPPPGYTPGDNGDCITFKVRGGDSDYEDALLRPSVQFKCYGSSEVEANACYRALYDALHNGSGEHVLHAEVETIGQTLEEPETGWYFVLSYFSVTLRQS